MKPAAEREAVVIVNTHSRHGARAASALYAALRERGFTIVAYHPAKNSSAAHKLVRRAAKAGAPTIVLAGGDGTMTKAVDALAHRESVLGVVPTGTGNSFALSLGIRDATHAVDVISGGATAAVDLGHVNGRYYANFATIGLASRIAGATSRSWKNVFGVGGYIAAGLRPFLRQTCFRAAIAWDGGELELQTEDVIIASGRYFGRTPVTPDANVLDGRLALFTAREGSALDVLRTYAAIALDAHTRLPNAHVVRAAAFTVRARPRQPLSVDGETVGRTPARFRIAPGALRVYVPRAGVPV